MALSAPFPSSLPLSVPNHRRQFLSGSFLLFFSRPLPTASIASGLCRGVARSVRAAATREEEWSAAIVSGDAASERNKASLLIGSFAEEPLSLENNVEEPPPAAAYGCEDGSDCSEETPAGKDLLTKLNVLIDSDNAYSILLYGSGALVALWISTAIISALDSVPLIPKAMEIVGLGFTVWFSSRYLIFKENRDEFFAKVEEIKEQVLGSINV